ncbi:MAG TPA: hypothetical protein VLC09_16145, partial [Polyangiaceae bacterium]|nr:hypothetical protein [Polyangiaceae bacterium]
ATIDSEFLEPLLGASTEPYPAARFDAEVLRQLTWIVGRQGIAGPLVACLTDDGEDHGLCLEHAEAVARALDGQGVVPNAAAR